MRKLKAYMILHDDNMRTLAQYLGVSRQTLSSRMNGHSSFTADEIIAIAERYKLGSEDILTVFF